MNGLRLKSITPFEHQGIYKFRCVLERGESVVTIEAKAQELIEPLRFQARVLEVTGQLYDPTQEIERFNADWVFDYRWIQYIGQMLKESGFRGK